MPHVPDTVPGKRVTGAGARTEGREASRQTSEVGAVCRKAARTVLCVSTSAAITSLPPSTEPPEPRTSRSGLKSAVSVGSNFYFHCKYT